MSVRNPALTPKQLAKRRREHALFAAALHARRGTALTDKAVTEVCSELIVSHLAEAELAADNERLRALIREERGFECHWCGTRYDEPHLETCEAFTPEGEVR